MADPNRRLAVAPRTVVPAGARVDLALSLPIFIVYHLGVVFLNIRNASDVVTGVLMQLAEGNKGVYLLITLGIGVVFATVFGILGRGHAFKPAKFVQIAIEGVAYAFLMRLAGSFVVGKMFAGKIAIHGFPGFIMSLGAGFYEELTYRFLLFGVGSYVIRTLLFAKGTLRGSITSWAWAFVCAGIFSAMHYIGPFAYNFELQSFVFRWVLGMALTLIFVFRGFAAAVWAHAFYDVWVMVF
jgi:hypothetical protein